MLATTHCLSLSLDDVASASPSTSVRQVSTMDRRLQRIESVAPALSPMADPDEPRRSHILENVLEGWPAGKASDEDAEPEWPMGKRKNPDHVIRKVCRALGG